MKLTTIFQSEMCKLDQSETLSYITTPYRKRYIFFKLCWSPASWL